MSSSSCSSYTWLLARRWLSGSASRRRSPTALLGSGDLVALSLQSRAHHYSNHRLVVVGQDPAASSTRTTSFRFLSSSSGSGSGGDSPDENANNNKDKKKSSAPPRENLDRDVLQPASQGILAGPHHSSGIPNLAGRHAHATLEPVRGRALQKGTLLEETQEALLLEEEQDDDDVAPPPAAGAATGASSSSTEEPRIPPFTSQRPPMSSSSSRRDGGRRHKMFRALASSGNKTGGSGGNGLPPPNERYNHEYFGPATGEKEDDDDDWCIDADKATPDEEMAYITYLLDEDKKFGYWNCRMHEDTMELDKLLKEKDARIQEHEDAVKAVDDSRKRHKQLMREASKGGGAAVADAAGEGDAEGETSTSSGGGSLKDKIPPLALEDDYDRWIQQNFDMTQMSENDSLGFEEDLLEEMTPEERNRHQRKYHSVSELPVMNNGAVMGIGQDIYTGQSTRFQMAKFCNPHPDSARQPKAAIPRRRKQPPMEFLEAHRRFLYIFGLPIQDPGDGSIATLNNPVHFAQVRKELARLAGVDSTEQVYPATTSSGYIGFDGTESMAAAIINGPTETFVYRPPVWSVFDHHSDQEYAGLYTKKSQEDVQAFCRAENDGAILLLSHLPRHNNPATLVQALFPANTPVGDAYSDVTVDDIFFLNSTEALVRFSSMDQAQSALSSQLVATQLLEQLGTYRIRLQRARREQVHAGYRGPFIGRRQVLKWGHRLVVDGDMPSQNFYISHADTVLAWNLDVNTTNYELSQWVKPYCAMPRDIEGSIEIVTCEDCLPTGRAYIGFDFPGEADAFLKAMGGNTAQFGNRIVQLKKLKTRHVAGGKYYPGPDKRPERTVDELWRSLDGWEDLVDPADLQTLYAAGIDKWILDDAFRVLRYKNISFGSYDQGIRRESLEPQKDRGQQYRDFVQLYVKTLIEALPTPERPGPIYEALFLPDEPVDLSIFDEEKVRRLALRSFRASVGGKMAAAAELEASERKSLEE